jgi:small-conductance mechanosensitive channel
MIFAAVAQSVSVVLAQATAPPAAATGAAGACGPVEDASAVCLSVFNATNSSTAAKVAQSVLVLPAKIGLILGVAVLAQRLVRRTIGRFVKAMHTERGSADTTAAASDHAPRAILAGGQAASGPGHSLRRAQRAETIGALLRSVSAVAIWAVAGLMILAELGLNLGPLIAGAGIVGIALGFGSQNLVRDFITGVFMLAEDQYGVGDVIDVGPATGRVEGVSLRTTRLRDINGTVWHVPNGEIQRVGNKSQQWARAVVDVDVAYDTDIKRATDVIKATADAMWSDESAPSTMIEEPEVLGVENLGADGIAIRLMVKTAPDTQLAVARELRARIKRAFDAEGIEIPFPQRTVWHRVDDGTAVVPAAMAAAGHGRSDSSSDDDG